MEPESTGQNTAGTVAPLDDKDNDMDKQQQQQQQQPGGDTHNIGQQQNGGIYTPGRRCGHHRAEPAGVRQ
jgi:hypothetical protein